MINSIGSCNSYIICSIITVSLMTDENIFYG
jgi:hypothetical protein